jgi:dTMP kinase
VPFITLEGIEGCGKSTQARRLAGAIGPSALLTQEPGGTLLGRGIRDLLLSPQHRGMTPICELLLYYADRAQHVAERIRPALQAGRTVISDRYADSSLAYQGFGRRLPMELIQAITEAATGGLRPDLTVFLDVSVETGLGRVGKRGQGQDRLESETLEFHARVRDGYLTLMGQDPGRWLRLDGEGAPDEVTRTLVAAVAARGLLVGDGLR